jgi:hypothetical protein
VLRARAGGCHAAGPAPFPSGTFALFGGKIMDRVY